MSDAAPTVAIALSSLSSDMERWSHVWHTLLFYIALVLATLLAEVAGFEPAMRESWCLRLDLNQRRYGSSQLSYTDKSRALIHLATPQYWYG